MLVNTLSQKTIDALDVEARALFEDPTTGVGTRFYFSVLVGDDAATLSQLMRSAAAYLDHDENDEIDLLDLDVFKSVESDDFIADTALVVGGPTIRARYESRWDSLEITAAWGSCTVQVYQGLGRTSHLKDHLAACGEM
nr:MAG TPA: hypothetical protein [Caudoviricetes sp.]